MDTLAVVDLRVWSGHFVFVRDVDALSDYEFLEALELRGYTRAADARSDCRTAYIMRAADWSGYADDWYYTAYNSTGIRDAVSRLGSRFEVLRIAIGDADQSFEFYHFIHGALRRAFHFEDIFGRTSVKLNSGPPLKCESSFSLGANPWPFLWAVADEIGIDSQAMTKSVSTYRKPYLQR